VLQAPFDLLLIPDGGILLVASVLPRDGDFAACTLIDFQSIPVQQLCWVASFVHFVRVEELKDQALSSVVIVLGLARRSPA